MVTEGYIDFSLYAQDRVESLKLKGFSREYIYKDLKTIGWIQLLLIILSTRLKSMMKQLLEY